MEPILNYVTLQSYGIIALVPNGHELILHWVTCPHVLLDNQRLLLLLFYFITQA